MKDYKNLGFVLIIFIIMAAAVAVAAMMLDHGHSEMLTGLGVATLASIVFSGVFYYG